MISIIIVNYNVKDYLSQCIDSINKSIIDEQFEIIIVDNNSSEYIKENEFNKSNCKLIQLSKNFGYAYAVNHGIESSSGKIILLLINNIIIEQII